MNFKWRKFADLLKHNNIRVKIGFLGLLLACIFFLLTLSNVFTETYDMERFSNAKNTIRSPITIENTKETERRSREAVQAVEDRYDISSEITQERVEYIIELFDAVKKLEEENITEGKSETTSLTTEQKVQYLQQILSNEITNNVDGEVLTKLVTASDNERSIAKELLTTSLYDTLNEGVRTTTLETAISNVNQKLRYSSLDDDFKQALYTIVNFAIVENSFFSVDRTEEAQKQAINNVEPVYIRAGEVIVREGQTITNEIYEKLALVGVLNNDRNIFPVIGLIILLVLLSGVMVYEIGVFSKYKDLDKGKLASILIISTFTVVLMKIVSLYTTPANQMFLLVPSATGAMLLKILLRERLAIVFAFVYAILGCIIFNSQIPGSLNMEAGVYLLLSQFAGIIFLANVKDRTAILKAGAGIVVINLLTVLVFLLLSFEKYSIADSLLLGSFAVVSALLSAVFTLGMLPFFEAGLGILSDTKLLTLSSPNHPLLRKILTEAPGTYHHSVMVANLSEASCEAIGANGLLARVAAYYHDLGKTIRPHYFIENQMGIKNPHDYLEPKQSAEIIISHPYDGAKLLKKHKLPKEIIDIAEQHHGTTLLKYFYYKAKDHSPNVLESDYRYPGPKPRSKEAAILSICDSVEAAVRSMNQPDKQKIDETVESIISDRLKDGQLNDSSLTFRELETVQKAICETLNGIYHSRIQYPTEKEVKGAN
ncbi:HD family phosphohydrolase [Aquibacillus kalidii]|uniref:HD family phosphohydrolase n=1 Tax=Aquibacillus kalidii TaxID=2762597 RepID=UPI0016478A37|nr:HDIG domain-containing metalloprotein [Aquibacillus kalidii]